MALLGSLGTVSNFCFAQALKESEVKALMAIEFTRLIWSALIGYLAFAEVPAAETWIGAVITFRPAPTSSCASGIFANALAPRRAGPKRGRR